MVATANATVVPAKGTPPPVVNLVPFTRASTEHTEPANIDTTAVPTASSVQNGPFDLPAYGYLRSVVLLVEGTGGTGTAATYKPDAPWSAIQELVLSDINGAPIVGPISGYDLYLIQKYGGYAFATDPTLSPAYVAPATSGNFSFALRIPVEIANRDGLGSLPNMNAGANYQLRITRAALADTYTANPTTVPSVRIRAWAECWAPPATTDANGAPQAIQPPALGTTQFWSRFLPPVAAGMQTVQLRRVGNLLRNLVLVHRDASGVRSSANLPDPLQLFWDGRLVTNESRSYRQHVMWERYGFQPDAGVLVYDYCHDFDSHPGGEMRDLWIPTLQSTRLEYQGNFGAAGTLEVLTNDVAPEGNVFLA